VSESKVVSHYTGDAGVHYFEWQRDIGRLGGRLNLFKFESYISDSAAVCDFGCGGGYLLERLPGCEKVGVEVSAEARRDATSRGVRTVASADELPDGHFDVIVSNHALEHTARPLDELIRLRRKLKVGGRMVFCLPVDDWRAQRTYRPDDINHHLYTWSPQLAGNLFTDAGLAVRSVRVLCHAWSPKAWRLFGWNEAVFRVVCFVNSIVKRRYQILLVAERTA
jgi:SAM-dependent methyltransferase